MKLGMIQGRLLRPEDGGMQEFPVCWEEEFDKANKLGLNHIEWIVTSRSFSYNPIFSRDCSGFSISSLCADNLVDDRFLDDRFLNENLDPICKAALDNKVMWITIPLLENSSISDPEKRKIFKEKILIYGDKYQNLNFSFEAETTAENALDIAKERDNFWLTYDTGNITSERIEHKDYITKTQEKISNVHLKDRTFDAKTVIPLSGDTPFDLIFNTLSSVNYNSLYTIQTARGVTGSEQMTMKQHKNIFERIYNATHS
jgi:hypothetical protein